MPLPGNSYRRRRCAGFTVTEILVALTLLGAVMVGGLEASALLETRSREVRWQVTARLLRDSMLAVMQADPVAWADVLQGPAGVEAGADNRRALVLERWRALVSSLLPMGRLDQCKDAPSCLVIVWGAGEAMECWHPVSAMGTRCLVVGWRVRS